MSVVKQKGIKTIQTKSLSEYILENKQEKCDLSILSKDKIRSLFD